MLGRASPRWTSPALWRIISISFNTLNEFASFWINLGEGIHSIVCSTSLVAHTSTKALNATLDKWSVASATFCSVWHIMQIDLPTVPIVNISCILKAWGRLLEPSIYRWIHTWILRMTGHVSRYMISAIIIRLILSSTARNWKRTSISIAILIRQNRTGVILRRFDIIVNRWRQGWIPIYHIFLYGQWRLVGWNLNCLFSFHHDWSFLDIHDVDRVWFYSFGLVWNSLYIWWGDNSHSLDHSDILLLLMLLLTIFLHRLLVLCRFLLRLSSNCSRRFLNDALTTIWFYCRALSRTLLSLLRWLLCLDRGWWSSIWGLARRVCFGCWGGWWALLSPPQ